MRYSLNLIFLLLCCLSNHIFAESKTPGAKLNIIAGSSMFNYQMGENIYEGGVTIDYDTMHLIADRVTTKNNEKNKMEKVIAYGTATRRAEYSTLPKPGDPVFHAKAKTITFYPEKSTAVLEGDVMVTQGKNIFHGPILIYNTKEKTVVAPPSKSGRATFVIDPKQFQS